MSDPTQRQQGIIGFFDILGYSSFLENNEPEDAAKTVLATLLDLQKQVIELHKEQFPAPNGCVVTRTMDEIKCLVFSDTILLALPSPHNLKDEFRTFHWILFLNHSILLYRHLFCSGLPIRGTITYGDFLIKETCFAGRPIIDAYRLTQRLDLAAVVISDEAKSQMSKIDDPKLKEALQVLSLEYLVPLNDGDVVRLNTLQPCTPQMKFSLKSIDIRQQVVECFWAHRKDIAPATLNKLNNTETFLRFVRMRFSGLFDGRDAKQQPTPGKKGRTKK